ncbi:hypothetical protein ABB37_04944 [Leptomonas pyrrhocoris]|uniref:Uncharacterized protein n=1 Tax=Leptomonas pyrrhocoris TaxID=157538 RepID=A0A0M9G0T6_LEPPY|nr:hypothetical protein ABB37_04944 [Leptomonas pyrrhocoris]KPA79869.1 hypothetical protein ABB37_04944 [Leptomonas pyrrhocoris]|eukprot:XP_015658308.1 hypothetical protein ABB37_04944 [Leptomonas pyrrhocoris]
MPLNRSTRDGALKTEEKAFRSSETSSTMTTDPSSDSDDSSTVGSSGSDSSNSSSSSSDASPNETRRPAASPTTTATNNTTSGGTTAQASQQHYVHLNPDLRFERPDNEYIPLPPLRDMQQVPTVLRRISVDKQRYPEGRHRMLDYFRVAVEMFVTEVRREYRQQYLSAQKNGKAMQRFTWKNSGELAICFACCCDMLKLLYDSIQPGPLKPLWDGFVGQLAPLLIIESRVPVGILSEQTYRVKYMDWQKGGTRYVGEQHSTNVRFPSAKDRRLKIETYLTSGAGVKLAVQLQPSLSAPHVAAAPPAAPAAAAVSPQPPSAMSPTRTVAEEARPPFAGRLPGSIGVKVPLPPGVVVARPPVKMPMKHSAGSHGQVQASAAPPLASTGVKQMPPEMKHLFWLSVLAHVKGGEATRAFPDDRLEALPGLLRLCEMTEETAEMRILMDVLAASSGGVQTAFERLGGLLTFRRFASHCIHGADAEALMQLVEQLTRWRVNAWGSTSQHAWQTNMDQKRTPDLTWLRTLPLIPEAKRAAWGALLLVLEQRFIFRTARPDETGGAGFKRQRAQSQAGDLRALLGDNVDMQKWVVPRVNIFSAVRLPVELRVPPLCSKLEEETVHFLNAKRTYAVATQREWQERIEKALAATPQGCGELQIPVWYDPYELLSVARPDLVEADGPA